MEGARRCGQCNVLNEAGRSYCKNCGKYLKIASRKEEKVTIWGTNAYVPDSQYSGQSAVVGSTQGGMTHGKTAAKRQAVICPQCGQSAILTDGMFPLACTACNYFFQAGLDPVVTVDAAGQVQGSGAVADTRRQGSQSAAGQGSLAADGQSRQDARFSAGQGSQSAAAQKKPGPLGRAPRDNSRMRLISLTSFGLMPEFMKEAGNLLGKDATVLKQLKSEQQISIWHTPAGWYARSLRGTPYYNGVPMNNGIQLKLSDGDLFTMEEEQLRVEILHDR